MITLENALEKAVYEQKDDNFGFDSRVEYQKQLVEMLVFVWGSFGWKIKKELISLGEQRSRSIEEIINELLNTQTFKAPANFGDRDIAEFNMINEAIRLSYKLINHYSENETITDVNFKIHDAHNFSSMVDYIIQGYLTLEGMREKLISNPTEYFREKEEVSSTF